MNDSIKSVKIMSLNVRGIISGCKRRKLFLWLSKQNVDIVLLQETHCTRSKLNGFKKSWQGKSYYGLTDSVHSRGVGILFKPSCDVKILSSNSPNDGRRLLLNITMYGKLITLVNVYGPNNEVKRKAFFDALGPWINANTHNANGIL